MILEVFLLGDWGILLISRQDMSLILPDLRHTTGYGQRAVQRVCGVKMTYCPVGPRFFCG